MIMHMVDDVCSYASSFLPHRVLSYCVKDHIHKATTRAFKSFRVCSSTTVETQIGPNCFSDELRYNLFHNIKE